MTPLFHFSEVLTTVKKDIKYLLKSFKCEHVLQYLSPYMNAKMLYDYSAIQQSTGIQTRTLDMHFILFNYCN